MEVVRKHPTFQIQVIKQELNHYMPMKGIMDYSYISLGQWCINCNYSRCTSESITFSFVENVMGGGK